MHHVHTNRNVSLSHELQREIALVGALSRPIPDYQQGGVGTKMGLCFAGFVFLMLCGPFDLAAIRILIRIAAESHDTKPLSLGTRWRSINDGGWGVMSCYHPDPIQNLNLGFWNPGLRVLYVRSDVHHNQDVMRLSS